MINIDGYEAVICCDDCLKDLSKGRYPHEAEDNLPPECHIVQGDEETPNEHYCAQCMAHELEEQRLLASEAGMSQSDWGKQTKSKTLK